MSSPMRWLTLAVMGLCLVLVQALQYQASELDELRATARHPLRGDRRGGSQPGVVCAYRNQRPRRPGRQQHQRSASTSNAKSPAASST